MDPAVIDRIVRSGMAVYPSDASERCIECGSRQPRDAIYVGRLQVFTDEGLPERFAACSLAHGRKVLRWVIENEDKRLRREPTGFSWIEE